MRKGYCNLADRRSLALHLQFHMRLLTFKEISAPLVFNQAGPIMHSAYACEQVASALCTFVF